MRILAVETATLAGSAALLEDGQVIGATSLEIPVTHSERLMAMVDRLLHECARDIEKMDALAVSIGPGSFTGLRVGIATVKGLALTLGLPVAPVPTLDALASNLPFADATVCPLLDARKGEVYCSLYRWRGDRMERLSEYLASSPQAAAARLTPPVIVIGDGVPACRPFLARLGPGVREAPASHAAPAAAVVGLLGSSILASGHAVAGDALQPLYLRASEAELKARRT